MWRTYCTVLAFTRAIEESQLSLFFQEVEVEIISVKVGLSYLAKSLIVLLKT